LRRLDPSSDIDPGERGARQGTTPVNVSQLSWVVSD
jgi:hypothetical protein